jgi:hypothetical protein
MWRVPTWPDAGELGSLWVLKWEAKHNKRMLINNHWQSLYASFGKERLELAPDELVKRACVLGALKKEPARLGME